MNDKDGSLRRCWVAVGLVVALVVALVGLVGCSLPKKSASSGMPTVAPQTTDTVSQATVSTSPTTITTIRTETPGIEPPSPTAGPQPTATPTLSAGTSVSPNVVTYTVQPGDSLYSIAAAYSMTVDQLMALNDITDPASLQVGQVLTISPGEAVATPTRAVTSGEETVHVVQKGENLYRIALKYGTTVEAIANRNGIVNPSLIRAGQNLFIPVGTGSSLPSGNIHVVQPGENLYRISLRYGTTVQAVMQANKLSSTVIYVGQRLRIP